MATLINRGLSLLIYCGYLAAAFTVGGPFAAIKVASTIMSLPNHFERVSLKENWALEMLQNGDKLLVTDPDEVVDRFGRHWIEKPRQ